MIGQSERAMVTSSGLLDTIVAASRRTVELRKARESLRAIEARAAQVPTRTGILARALSVTNRINVIAECKRRSPARGILRENYDPAELAASYERGGAAALSVLTEPGFFDGSLQHLALVGRASELPVLRKDFVIDEYQIHETRAAGADAVLLIAAALSGGTLSELLHAARTSGLEALVEVHDQDELARVLDAGATLVGVNSRNLQTLHVDLAIARALIARIPKGVVAVAESGIRTTEDLMHLRAAGYSAFLIGERLMTSPDPGAALADLLAAASRMDA